MIQVKCKLCGKYINAKCSNKRFCKECARERGNRKSRQYKQSKGGKEVIKKYKQTKKHKESQRKSHARPKYKARRREIYHSEIGQERAKAYYNNLDNYVKDRLTYFKRLDRNGGFIHKIKFKELKDLFIESDNVCKLCYKDTTFTKDNNLSIDHIYPLSRAGKGRIYTIKDIQLICKPCNSKKNAHLVGLTFSDLLRELNNFGINELKLIKKEIDKIIGEN